MATMMVRSFIPCPICGKEMRQTGGGWYYEHDAGLVELECRKCNLQIREFGFEHGFEDGEAHSYGKLMNVLKERIKK